jgi:hypothetical protein
MVLGNGKDSTQVKIMLLILIFILYQIFGFSFESIIATGKDDEIGFSTIPNLFERVSRSRVVSELPIPEGFTLISAQSAPYYDEAGGVLHVWYGLRASGRGEEGNMILYTNTTDLHSWSAPVVVISLPSDGIRDPTIFVEGENIYLFTQVYNRTTRRYHPIRLYKTSRRASFWDPAQYQYLGVAVDLGSPGEFDDEWVASFCLMKRDGTYYGAYEAKDSYGRYSIGRTFTNNIESIPYIKDGQLLDKAGRVVRNPLGPDQAIAPDTFANSETLYIHYDAEVGPGESWRARYLQGDYPRNSMALSEEDLNPTDPYRQHNNIAHIGFLDGRYTFLMQSGDTSADWRLRLYMEPPPSVSGSGEIVRLEKAHSSSETFQYAKLILPAAMIISGCWVIKRRIRRQTRIHYLEQSPVK